MKKQINWKEEAGKWQGHYEDWRVSGVTQKEYCKEKGLRFDEFKARIQMMREKGLLGPCNSGFLAKPIQVQKRSGFSEVKITGAPESATPDVYCEIRFGSSGRLVIENEGSLEKLRELVGVLRL